MSTEPSAASRDIDVFVSHAPSDQAWADHLQWRLRQRGLRAVTLADHVEASSGLGSSTDLVARARALVVLWSGYAAESTWVRQTLAPFLAQSDHRPLIPVELGTTARGRLETRPPELISHNWLVLTDDEYRAGPQAAQTPWNEIADRIAQELDPAATTRAAEPLWLEVIDGGRQIGWAWTLAPTRAIWSIRETPSDVTLIAGTTYLLRTPQSGMVHAEVREVVPSSPRLDDGYALLALPVELQVPTLLSDSASGDDVVEVLVPNQPGARGWLAVSPRGERLLHLGVGKGREFVGCPIVSITTTHVLGVLGYPLRGEDIRHVLPITETAAPDLPEPRMPTPSVATDAPPSTRVHTDAWTIEDKLDYALYARSIEQFILHPNTQLPLVISVQGPWGQGKTSLMRMVQERLDWSHQDFATLSGSTAPQDAQDTTRITFRTLFKRLGRSIELDADPPRETRTVWFNAWKYQSSEALWAGLADAILQQLSARLSVSERELFWLRLQQRRIDPAAIRRDLHRLAFERVLPGLVLCAVALCLIVLATAFDVIGDLAGRVAGVATVVGGGLSWLAANAWAYGSPLEGRYAQWVRQPEYAKPGYFHAVEHDMRTALELLAPADRPLVVFIDDLDRCAPAKIGEVLEAINLFLSGDYPNCAFVLGVDTQVVAAAMEVVHRDVIERLHDRHGELGWRFMDKFVQLPFVMPRLSPEQRKEFVGALLVAKDDNAERRTAAQQAASEITKELESGTIAPAEAAARVGDLDVKLAAAAPDAVRKAAEAAIAAGAQAFGDADEEMTEALHDQMSFLSDNPRTIKRAVNLYRFYRFTAWARQASPLGLEGADPQLIARWVVVAVRWPSFVRWLQANAGDDSSVTVIDGLVSQAREANSHSEWRAALERGGEQPWHTEPELWLFLRNAAPPLDLARAEACGLW
ncbi:MAG TPA: P-loop NTPase fold protein [Conexibacter sp.]|jgi:hypothetical protein|nr:P-loop NTPase fold protein [Conexibacter sp.]